MISGGVPCYLATAASEGSCDREAVATVKTKHGRRLTLCQKCIDRLPLGMLVVLEEHHV